MANDILPDSRLKSTIGDIMADWRDGDGNVTRLCLQPIYCFNCGKHNGYVPRDIMSFVSWLCEACSATWGDRASLHQSSDREFWLKVAEEMSLKYGRALTQQELWQLAEQDKLSAGLQLLMRESPFRNME
jgi:hypothetical protein